MNSRIWLVTGISGGIGKALADAVMERGDFLIGTFRNEWQVAEFNERNVQKAYAVLLDITRKNDIEQQVKHIMAMFGRIDVLVNNAGMGFAGAIEETCIQEVKDVFEVNFFGTLQMTQAVLPYMRKEKSGHIVQISSHGGIKAFAGFGIYNASKFALEGFSEAMALEVAPLGIKVSIVEPGPFRTNFAGTALTFAKNVIDEYAETAGQFRAKLKSADGHQEGDPVKASHAIINLVNAENPSLRLPLGKTALNSIRMKLNSVHDDLERNKDIAESVVH